MYTVIRYMCRPCMSKGWGMPQIAIENIIRANILTEQKNADMQMWSEIVCRLCGHTLVYSEIS